LSGLDVSTDTTISWRTVDDLEIEVLNSDNVSIILQFGYKYNTIPIEIVGINKIIIKKAAFINLHK
jgi:hypothetical protein